MRTLLFIICFSISSNAFTQPKDLSGQDYTAIAAYYIKYLKNGSLFVRLQTKSRKIAILKKAGNLTAAEKVKQDQLEINQSIVKAFRESFTFCPVYFFYSNDSKYIWSYEIDSVHFLDEQLKFDPSIRPSKQFLIAEFDIVRDDTIQNFENTYEYRKDSANQMYRRKIYNGSGSNMSFGALIIKSDKFIQLPYTFPYYTRSLSTIPILRRSHSKVVSIMNSQLNAFWGQPDE